MKRRRRELNVKYQLILVIISILAIFLIISASLKEATELNPVTKIVKDSTLTMVEIMTAPVTYVKDLTTNYQNYIINTKTPSYQRLAAENEALKAELKAINNESDIDYPSQYQPLLAKVIVRNINVWYNQFTINRGQKNHLKIGDAVMNQDGLVGIVNTVSNRYATVNLIVNNREQMVIPATILSQDKQEFGYIQGFDPKEGTLLFHKINDQLTVKVGDKVVTSSLGGKLPVGLNIGEVSRIVRDEYGIITLLKIKPTASLNHLNYVTVLSKVTQ